MTTFKDLQHGTVNPFQPNTKAISYRIDKTLEQGVHKIDLITNGTYTLGFWLDDIYVGMFCGNSLTFELANDVYVENVVIKEYNELGEIESVKLEKGDIATEWTPAPEDFNNLKGESYALSQHLRKEIILSLNGSFEQDDFIGLWLGNDKFVGFLDNQELTFDLTENYDDEFVVVKTLSEKGVIDNAKLEKGDIATEYSPAPEDGYGYTGSDGAYHIQGEQGFTSPNIPSTISSVAAHNWVETTLNGSQLELNETTLFNGNDVIDFAGNILDFIASDPGIFTKEPWPEDKEKVEPFTMIVESAADNFLWYEELAITIGKIKPANMVYITRPLITRELKTNESIRFSEMTWNYMLNGSWKLSEKPFVSLADKGVIKLPTTSSLQNKLFDILGGATSDAITHIMINGSYRIDTFETSHKTNVDSGTVELSYSIPAESNLGVINKVEVFNNQDKLSESSIYVPLVQDVEMKHTIIIKEGV